MLLNAGHTLDPTVESVWRIRHGFDQPIILQYLFYLRNLIEGDFGLSYYYSGRPVVELLAPAVRTTIEWQIPALLVAVIGAVGVAIATSVYRKQWLDSATTTLLSIGLSFPEFVIATFLVLVFSIRLRVLPVAGTTTPIHLVLPIVTMAIPLCAALSQVLRSELAEVIQQNYVRTARAKGLTEHRVLMVHALPNAILPFLTVVAIQVGRCIGGAFLIETIYNIPGVGWLVVSSVLQRDYPVVLAVTMVMTFAFVINSLVFDLVSGILDPRVCFVAKEQERL